MEFKNRYSGQRRKEEFFTKQENKEDLTDQSQITTASISSMAKKFGIDVLIAKAQILTRLSGIFAHFARKTS